MWYPTTYNTTKLTLELRDIVDNGDNSVDIWNFSYPSYYEGEKKKEFEKKVIDHYYFRQIGQETVGRFLHQFRTKIREIMPYYIQMYKTVEIMNEIEDPFGNIDITETFEQNSEGTSNGSSSSNVDTSSSDESNRTVNGGMTHKYSNTPQGEIDNLDRHMTEASIDNQDSSENGSSSSDSNIQSSGTNEQSNTGKVTHTLTRKGNQGVNTYAHDMIEFRTSIIDVDMMIINELNSLFLAVY